MQYQFILEIPNKKDIQKTELGFLLKLLYKQTKYNIVLKYRWCFLYINNISKFIALDNITFKYYWYNLNVTYYIFQNVIFLIPVDFFSNLHSRIYQYYKSKRSCMRLITNQSKWRNCMLLEYYRTEFHTKKIASSDISNEEQWLQALIFQMKRRR